MSRFVRLLGILPAMLLANLLAILLAIHLAACAALPPAEPRPFPDEVDRARDEQNARLLAGEGWRVHEEAKAGWEAAPGEADALYLYARTIPDRAIQEDLFERVVRLDPSLFHANRGLAVVHLDRRQVRDAERFARRALVIRPGDRSTRLLLARSLAASNRRDEAETLLRSLVIETPADPVAVAALMDFLSVAGRSAEALEAFLMAVEAGAPSGPLVSRAQRLIEGSALSEPQIERLGRSEGLRTALALHAGEGAAALSASSTFGTRDQRIRAALMAGAWEEARDTLAKGLAPVAEIEGVDRRAAITDELIAALGSKDVARIARALSAAGFPRAAADAANRALAAEPGREDVRTLAADFAGWDLFITEVRDVIRRSYWAYKRREETGEFDAVVRSLAEISIRRLGRDVVSGIPVDSYPFVGSVARTDADGAPPEWEAHGILFVFGQRSGGPVQGTMMRIVAAFDDMKVNDVPYELIVGEGRLFPTFFEFDGGNIAGFAMPGRVVLDLDQLAGLTEGRRRASAAARPPDLWPAGDETTRRSLWFPNGIRARLAGRSGQGNGSADGNAAIFTALRHEEGHILDADDYTPFHWHLPSLLYEVIAHGFSISSMEETLEKNAEGHALKTCRTPRWALRHTMGFLPWRRSALPHSAAYHELVEDLVKEIDEHPERYPSIDRRFNILQQMDRLTDAELKRAIDEAIE